MSEVISLDRKSLTDYQSGMKLGWLLAITGHNVLLISPYGEGKSQMIEVMDAYLRQHYHIMDPDMSCVAKIDGANLDPVLLQGVTMIKTNEEGELIPTTVAQAALGNLYRTHKQHPYARCVVALDEIQQSGRNLQGALLACLSTGRWGGYPFDPKRLGVIAMANPTSFTLPVFHELTYYSRTAQPFSQALLRRFIVMYIQQSHEDRASYFGNLQIIDFKPYTGFQLKSTPFRYPEMPSSEAYAEAALLWFQFVAPYMEKHNKRIQEAHKEQHSGGYEGFETIASYEQLASALAAVWSCNDDTLKTNQTVYRLAIGCLGAKSGSDFYTYYADNWEEHQRNFTAMKEAMHRVIQEHVQRMEHAERHKAAGFAEFNPEIGVPAQRPRKRPPQIDNEGGLSF